MFMFLSFGFQTVSSSQRYVIGIALMHTRKKISPLRFTLKKSSGSINWASTHKKFVNSHNFHFRFPYVREVYRSMKMKIYSSLKFGRVGVERNIVFIRAFFLQSTELFRAANFISVISILKSLLKAIFVDF